MLAKESHCVSQDDSLADYASNVALSKQTNSQSKKKRVQVSRTSDTFDILFDVLLSLVTISTNKMLLQECCGNLNRLKKERGKQAA